MRKVVGGEAELRHSHLGVNLGMCEKLRRRKSVVERLGAFSEQKCSLLSRAIACLRRRRGRCDEYGRYI